MWHGNYYDGIISGMLRNLKNGKQYWFDQIGSFDYLDYNWPKDGAYELEAFRVYAVFELTAEQLDFKNYWHEEFSRLVGNHTNYTNDRRTLGTHPGWMESGFYERHKEAIYPETDRKWPIGWFAR